MSWNELRTKSVYGLLLAGALGYAWYRNSKESARDPTAVSSLPNGTDLSMVSFRGVGPDSSVGADPAGLGECHLIVVYLSNCPHCHAAATRLANLLPNERLPTTWVPMVNDSLAAEFAAVLPEGAVTRYVPDAKAVFKNKAVPAAFVVGADNKVRSSFGYTGKEDRALLQPLCG